MVTTKPILDTTRPNDQNLYWAKIRVTFNRRSKYYEAYNKKLSPEQFERIINGKKRTADEMIIYKIIERAQRKIDTCIEGLNVFTFYLFEEVYKQNSAVTKGISGIFEQRIEELKVEKRIGTATLFECALASLEQFKPRMQFADVTPKCLKDYETWMLEKKNKYSTIGIYLRNLRAIFNIAIRAKLVHRDLYPFGKRQEGKYEIPAGTNVKKAMSKEDISALYFFEPSENDRYKGNKIFALDMWKFSYLCNGLNVTDILNLKWENIDGEFGSYIREKTKRSVKVVKKVVFSLKPDALAIIKSYSVEPCELTDYVFPFFYEGITEEEKKRVAYNITRRINKNLKSIGKLLAFKGKVTTLSARHSFATILKRTGSSLELIRELLGHETLKTTRNYLDSFENETIFQSTQALIPQRREISAA
ncbi:tyrosine-type recombinase/integrase [Niabella sp. CJ426]|uniref:tyrosine-type recombinase/integrase n=1 Tax=Niabella sp. CJ426 TaxID=3393740 RepID=UPI003CFDF04E